MVRVDPGESRGPVHRAVFGLSLAAWTSQKALLDPATGSFRPELVRALREMHPGSLRFPGGGNGTRYHWRDSVGRNRKGPEPEYAFGTDEFLALCRELDAEPVITVNWTTGNPSEAAAWVEYCNGSVDTPMGALRAANGHPEPYGVRYWELGNEPWMTGRVTEYAMSLDAWATVMRKADPSIRLGAAAWHEPGWMNHRNPDTVPWNETLVERAAGSFDALNIHSYAWIDRKPERVDGPFIETVLSYATRLGEWFDANRALLRRAGLPETTFWFTEHNGYYGERGMSVLLCETFTGVLNARMLMQYVRHGVPVACYWNALTDGWGHFSALAFPDPESGTIHRRPAYYIYRLFGELAGKDCELLSAEVEGPVYTSRPIEAVPGGENNPYVDALAMRRADGGIVVFLANSSPDDPFRVRILGVPGAVERALLFAGDGPLSQTFGLRDLAVERDTDGNAQCILPPCSVAGVLLVR